MAHKDVTTGEIMEVLEFMKDRMMVKEDLAAYATKEDLRSELATYATKEDLRSELATYATKEDLRSELAAYATREDLVQFKSDILSAIDGIASHDKNYDIELAAARGTLDRHEERLEIVEQKLNLAAS